MIELVTVRCPICNKGMPVMVPDNTPVELRCRDCKRVYRTTVLTNSQV